MKNARDIVNGKEGRNKLRKTFEGIGAGGGAGEAVEIMPFPDCTLLR